MSKHNKLKCNGPWPHHEKSNNVERVYGEWVNSITWKGVALLFKRKKE